MTAPIAPADLRILLAFPPQGHPTQPYLALPSLKAWLAQHEFTDCTVWDINLEAYDDLISGERLELAVERIRERAEQQWRFDDHAKLEGDELSRYRLYADALASGPYIVAEVDRAKHVIRDAEAFYDRPKYLWAMRTFEAGLKLLSTEYHPTLFTGHNYTQATSIDSSADLFAGVDDREQNMFVEYYEQHVLPRIERERPDVLGLSVTYGSQMVPALTLATLVKRRWPEIHITLGGGMLAYIGQRLAQAGPLFERVDSIAIYEGERPLLELCRALAAAGGSKGLAAAGARPDLSGVSNLLYLGDDGQPAANGELRPLPIDDLPTPDFADLDLQRYLSGELVLPIAPARGCYYEKCGFCTLYTAIGPTFRERSVERLVDDLKQLVALHDTPYFYFIMDDLPPLMAKRIPQAFSKAGLNVKWWCDARLEERIFDRVTLDALYGAGCRKLMFGFESGSQRLLDLVEKGTDLQEAQRVLRDAHEAGISATLYTMVGLPTETRDEADASRAFIVRNADWISEISLQIFNLDMVSPMYRDPERYGISHIIDDPRDLAPGQRLVNDLARYLEHESASGMTRDEVKQAFNSVLGAASEALPALRGDNFLYYRYKSHIFLYLCRFGRDVFRQEHVTKAQQARRSPVARSADLPSAVRVPSDVTLQPLSFPYGRVIDHIDRAWSDPAPLGGAAVSQPMADESASVHAEPCVLAYLGGQHRFVDLGTDAARLLATASERGTPEALGLFGEEHRGRAASFLDRALRSGLLEVVE